MSKPNWQANAEKSLKAMGYKVEQVKYFDWAEYGNNVLINDGTAHPSPAQWNYSQQRKNGQRL